MEFRFYTSKFGPNWRNADAKCQAAALVLYFKRGEENLERTLRSRPIDLATGWPEFFTIEDQLKQDGGPFVLDPSNWEKLNRAAASGPVLFRDLSPPQRAAPAATGPVLFRDLPPPPRRPGDAPAAAGPVLFRDLSPPPTGSAGGYWTSVVSRSSSPRRPGDAPAAAGPVLFRDLSPPQRAAPAATGPVSFRDLPPEGQETRRRPPGQCCFGTSLRPNGQRRRLLDHCCFEIFPPPEGQETRRRPPGQCCFGTSLRPDGQRRRLLDQCCFETVRSSGKQLRKTLRS